MTQTRLAAECDVDARNIRRYESGEAPPSGATLAALAAVLEFPEEFFQREAPVIFEPRGASFRSMSTMTQLQAEGALSAGVLAMELTGFLEKHLDLPMPKLPDMHGAHPEQAARELRSAWGLGNQPIPNVVHRLEEKGVRVFSLVEECRAVDAFCVQHNGVPFVFLNTIKSAEHSRFDACHELAHLTLHQSGERRGKLVEQEAHRFAAAFLMPADDVLAHAPGGTITTLAIVRGKKRWGVSAIAYARRLYSLGLLREWEYKQLCIDMSRRGFRTNEPEPMPREQSQLLQKAFALLKEKGIERRDVARELSVTVGELDRLVFGLMMVSVRGDGQSSRTARPSLRLIASDARSGSSKGDGKR